MTAVIHRHLHVQSLSPVVEIQAFLPSITGCHCSVQTVRGITYTYVRTHWGELLVQAGGCNRSPLKYPQGERKTRHDAMFWKVSWPTRYHTVCITHTIYVGKKIKCTYQEKILQMSHFCGDLQKFCVKLTQSESQWSVHTYSWPCLLTSSALILHWPFNGHVG